jgi:four helix bundle protein
MKINRFEDLECWRAARSLTKSIYSYARRAGFSKDFRLSGQITGAASSVMNNIQEMSIIKPAGSKSRLQSG